MGARAARPSPAWITEGVMYQIQPRAFTPEGTLAAATDRLPRLAELGVTILYLCPVFVADDDPDPAGWSPRQKKSGMQNPRNPYRIKDYFNVDPEYGSNGDLKAFVSEAHRLGLRVLLDLVYLHCGPNAVFLREHPGYVERDAAGRIKPTSYNFPKINHSDPGLRAYLWSNMEHLLREFDVDGFRCDVSDGVPIAFWEEAWERLRRIRPDIGMLAEGRREADQLKAFDLDYVWNKPFRTWDDAEAIRRTWLELRSVRPRGGAKFIWFTENHDLANDSYAERLERRWGARRMEAALAALFTLDGVPFLYNGQEVADTARHSIFGRAAVDWSAGDTAAGRERFAFCRRLCALRRSEPALTRGDLRWLDNTAPRTVFSLERTAGDSRVLAVVNLGGEAVRVTLRVPAGERHAPLLVRGAEGSPASGFALEPHGFYIGHTLKTSP